MSGYSEAGASLTKSALRKFLPNSGSPLEDIDLNNYTLRQRARMLQMAAPIAAAAINTNRTKVVGHGLRLKCRIDEEILGISKQEARKWCKKTEAEFRLWCKRRESCDALGVNNFYELQQVAVKSWLTSGDVFVVLKRQKTSPINPYTLCIQLVEADRICTPFFGAAAGAIFGATEGKCSETGNDIHDGVEVDKNGRVVAYHICNKHPNSIYNDKPTEWKRVIAVNEKTGLPNVLQIMDAERPDQYRGVTYLAPVIEMILQSRRYTESELTAAIIQTYFTAWTKTKTDPTEMPIFGHGLDSDGETSDRPVDEDPQMGPGNVLHLRDGEEVVFGNPNIPTAGFEKFMKTLTKMIGAALELPYDVLTKEFNASYSAAKGALEEAWEVFKMRRSWFVSDFCQPIYEDWLAEAVATGRISAPGFFNDPLVRAAWCGARWDGPAQTHLDPLKEAKANEIVVRNGWKSNEQVTREFYGENFEENIKALEDEIKRLRKLQKNYKEVKKGADNDAEYSDEDED